MQNRHDHRCIRMRRLFIVALCLALTLAGIVIAQTLPGTACPNNPFEVHGLLYSGSAPAGFLLGDSWAQGATFHGVLDEDGMPAYDGSGHLFRAVHMVDPNWGNSGDGFDPTLFAGGNKNLDLIGLGQSPWDWGGGGGSPQKNDITNTYFHTRVDPATGDRWVFVGAETRSINGDSHVDFEFNQAGVVVVGSTGGHIVGLGPDGGRTVNDFLIITDFEQGGTHPTVSIRVWDGTQFVVADAPGAIYSATNLIDIPHGSGGAWKHFSSDGAMVNLLTHLQFVEGAANLTALGIIVDPCRTDSTFIAKTRSSSSWTADLKDFAVVSFPLEIVPDLEVHGPERVCSGEPLSASVIDHSGLPKTTFFWNAAGCGRITSDPTMSTVQVEADETCGCSIRLNVTAMGGDCRVPSSASITIPVGDGDAPVLSGRPADQTTECDAVPVAPTLTASDHCSAGSVEFSEQPEPGACQGYSSIRRTWDVVDDCNNLTTHMQTVTVQDTTSPVLLGIPQDVEVACDAIPEPAEAHAQDNCSQPEIGLEETITPGRCVGEETIRRAWTAFDDCGNEATRTQTITVVDRAAPQLMDVPADTSAECNAVPAPASVWATDNCSNAPVALKETRLNGSCIGDWTLTREWSAADSCGNRMVKSQTINVEDAIPPVLSGVPADTVVECSAVPPPAQVSAGDNCSNPVLEFSESVKAGPGPGEFSVTRTWTATDACGNQSSRSQRLHIVDTINPQLQGTPADQTVSCDEIPPPAPVTATDNCGQPLVEFDESTIPGSCAGRWTIIRTWTVVDDAGNQKTHTQTIHVADTTPPTFENDLPQDMTVECDAVPAPADVSADDNCSGITIRLQETAQPGNCADRQTILRTWTATDSCGNTSYHGQRITVIDTSAPTLSADPADIVAECGNVPSPVTLTAADTCDSNVPVQFNQQSNPGACIGASTLQRTWRATDDCGNLSQVSQTVSVRDTTAPTVSISPTSQQVICEGRPATVTLRGTDRCSPAEFSVSVLHAITANSRDQVVAITQADGSVRISATGPAYISGYYVAQDDCGNSSAPFEFTLTTRFGWEACSQGFWKNHVDRWGPTGFTPTMRFVDAFQITDFSSPELPSNFNVNMTFLEAASRTGGSFDQLLLQGSAALLNAAHPDVEYPYSVKQVQSVMQDAFAGRITFDEGRGFINAGQAVESECGCPVQ